MARLRWMKGLALLWRVTGLRVFRQRRLPLQQPKFRRGTLLHRQRKAFGAVWLLSGPLRRRLCKMARQIFLWWRLPARRVLRLPGRRFRLLQNLFPGCGISLSQNLRRI